MKRGGIQVVSLRKGLKAITKLYNYELELKQKEAEDNAIEVFKQWKNGNEVSAAHDISFIYRTGDLMLISYFMKELRNQMIGEETNGTNS